MGQKRPVTLAIAASCGMGLVFIAVLVLFAPRGHTPVAAVPAAHAQNVPAEQVKQPGEIILTCPLTILANIAGDNSSGPNSGYSFTPNVGFNPKTGDVRTSIASNWGWSGDFQSGQIDAGEIRWTEQLAGGGRLRMWINRYTGILHGDMFASGLPFRIQGRCYGGPAF
jgi:hypothetical protein